MGTVTAKLLNWKGAAAQAIARAETRYVELLAAELGGRAGMTAAHAAWLSASVETDELPKQAWPQRAQAAIDKWEKAARRAANRALEGLAGFGQEPHFDLEIDGDL
jgi:hypothetical protein